MSDTMLAVGRFRTTDIEGPAPPDDCVPTGAGPSSAGAADLLVLSDDVDLKALAKPFADRGFQVEYVRDLRSGLTRAVEGTADLVILDAALLDGIAVAVLRRIRSRSWVPVVVVGADVNRAAKIAALEAGADGYWVKPVDPDEVLAGVQALLRRSRFGSRQPAGSLASSGISIEPALRQVSVGDQRVKLTSLEYEVLEYLVRAAGRIVSRDELMAVILQREATPWDRALDVHISRLRKKLGARGSLIWTVRGVGYIFSPLL